MDNKMTTKKARRRTSQEEGEGEEPKKLDRNKVVGSRWSCFCPKFWRDPVWDRMIYGDRSWYGYHLSIVYGWRDAHYSMKIVLLITSGTLNYQGMPARGRYSWRMRKKEKRNPRIGGDTTVGTPNIVTAPKRSTHCLTAVQQNVVQQWRPRSDPPTHNVLQQQYSKRRIQQ